MAELVPISLEPGGVGIEPTVRLEARLERAGRDREDEHLGDRDDIEDRQPEDPGREQDVRRGGPEWGGGHNSAGGGGGGQWRPRPPTTPPRGGAEAARRGLSLRDVERRLEAARERRLALPEW